MKPNENHNPTWPEIMRPTVAADYLSISVSKLAKLRMRDATENGPPFVRLGGIILYRRADLDTWLEQHKEGHCHG
ncbi:helix-turn-helix domain-containing protein [Tropicimonas marinistellae]|uniref:helix-turn-helix domain-containing protein n=1 Tax=Tropicimonas marinistellae TaxID=1739787 RepID=UPI00082C7756|nr:helix-turn-helix domain-containing protein [Tropicimonas marinistellae]